MPEKRPTNTVLAYEMLEIRERMSDVQEELDNLGIVGKWVPGLQSDAYKLREQIGRFTQSIENILIQGMGFSMEDIERMYMLEEIDDPGNTEEME